MKSTTPNPFKLKTTSSESKNNSKELRELGICKRDSHEKR